LLLVDDESAVRRYTMSLLEALGYSVISEPDGPSAIRTIGERGDDIALVLLDLIMPQMDGFETFEQIKRLNPSLPVVLTSGYDDERLPSRFADIGFSGFLQKPYQTEPLVRILDGAKV